MKISRHLVLSLFLSLAFALPMSYGQAQNAPSTAPAFRELYRKLEYMIPMRDGIKLYTSVYVPKDKPGKHPILLERTPYGAGPYGPDSLRSSVRGSRKLLDNGFIFAYQDVRGMGKSEGEFVNDRPQLLRASGPHDIDESTDTYDAIDYLVKHVPENNGRVGLWGISYPGFYAGVGAINSHPALKAASPQAPVSNWFIGDDFHHHGAFFLMDAIGFARFGQSRTSRPRPAPPINTEGDPVKFYLEAGGLGDITEKYFADTDGLWKYLMLHGTYDEYWQSRDLPQNMKNIRCAVMTVGGWFDAEDCWGAINTYKGTEANNRGLINTLVMGPWYHGMWAAPQGQKFGDMDFGQPTSTYYQEKIEFPFFDSHLNGNGRFRLPEAAVFDTGAYVWHGFPKWPPRQTKEQSFYLQPGKKVSDTAPSAKPETEYDEYVSDPAQPVPYQGGTIRSRTREYMLDDQRFASARADVLTYQTEILPADKTLAGPVFADLFVSSTGTDADFVVKVIDVFPDDAPGKLAGYQMLVRAEILRSKFRNSHSNPSPLPTDRVEPVSFSIPDIFHTLRKGHRLMIQVQSSWFPLVDRNPQKFMDIYAAHAADFQKATLRLYHTGQYPSRIRVGVLAK